VGGRVEGRETPTLRPGLAHGYNSMSRVRPTPTMMPNCKEIAGHMTPSITLQHTSGVCLEQLNTPPVFV